MNFKKNEITEYFNDFIKENSNSLSDNDFIEDLHYHSFNTDYYIIGTYDAKKWLGSYSFDIIGFIKDYEMDNFGELYTDLSEPEHVVNMYVYIIGEEILENVIDEVLYEIENNKTKQNKTQKESK